MKSTLEIATRIKEIIFNGTWVANTNYKLQLENLDCEIAVKPTENLNTISI
ncbi:hypothetical protein [Flavobacterium sp.]|uniref:hypothetical protein n=1 Tax=Flavobacterium sp. TaxID=239 RepID=UPI0031D0187A